MMKASQFVILSEGRCGAPPAAEGSLLFSPEQSDRRHSEPQALAPPLLTLPFRAERPERPRREESAVGFSTAEGTAASLLAISAVGAAQGSPGPKAWGIGATHFFLLGIPRKFSAPASPGSFHAIYYDGAFCARSDRVVEAAMRRTKGPSHSSPFTSQCFLIDSPSIRNARKSLKMKDGVGF